MFQIIFYGIMWCFAIYGIMIVIQEFVWKKNYDNIKEKVNMILIVKNAENEIENYIRDISLGKNFYNALVVIDDESDDDTYKILKQLENEDLNIRVYSKCEGKKYLETI